MLKKILKIVGIILLLLVISAFAIPYFFKDQIGLRKVDALKENIPQENVTLEQIRDLRNRDSLLALGRRNQVLFQWQKNSVSNNLAIKNKID